MPITPPTPPTCPPCIEQPGVPPTIGTPGYVIYAPDLGWDAGANSKTQLTGDVILSFTVENVVGALVEIGRAHV